MPIRENTPQRPVNPYGETKLIMERALHWYSIAHRLTSVALRYFNAAGADPSGSLGEAHNPETHLIPLAIAASTGRRTIDICGDDYPTRDGSCIRDFVHVSDLADAHVRALDYLLQGGRSTALNLGSGVGHTVKEVISAVERRVEMKVLRRVIPRRQGDPAVLIADSEMAQQVLGWNPQYSSLESIVASACKWHSTYATGNCV
jgi:UDP-glucose-4-epimerase GalE